MHTLTHGARQTAAAPPTGSGTHEADDDTVSPAIACRHMATRPPRVPTARTPEPYNQQRVSRLLLLLLARRCVRTSQKDTQEALSLRSTPPSRADASASV